MSEVVVKLYKHADDELWRRIGRYFADRKIRRDLGGPMSSDDTYTWWIAEKDGAVAGFAAIEAGKSAMILRHSYVLAPHRGNGVYAALLAARIAFAKAAAAKLIRTTATSMSLPKLLKAGFTAISDRGQYTVVERAL